LKYTFKELLEEAKKTSTFKESEYDYVIPHFFKKLKAQIESEEPIPIYIPRFGKFHINYEYVFAKLGKIYIQAKNGAFWHYPQMTKLVNALKNHKNKKHYEKHLRGLEEVGQLYAAWQQSNSRIREGDIVGSGESK
jgi:hypothetical protein